jgi:hypothetical protein
MDLYKEQEKILEILMIMIIDIKKKNIKKR